MEKPSTLGALIRIGITPINMHRDRFSLKSLWKYFRVAAPASLVTAVYFWLFAPYPFSSQPWLGSGYEYIPELDTTVTVWSTKSAKRPVSLVVLQRGNRMEEKASGLMRDEMTDLVNDSYAVLFTPCNVDGRGSKIKYLDGMIVVEYSNVHLVIERDARSLQCSVVKYS
jgi:hypothetical protein